MRYNLIRPVNTAEVARAVSGQVDTDTPPLMGAEDFSFMLNERPGAYIFLGNGDTAMGTTRPATLTTTRSRSAQAGMPGWWKAGCPAREGVCPLQLAAARLAELI